MNTAPLFRQPKGRTRPLVASTSTKVPPLKPGALQLPRQPTHRNMKRPVFLGPNPLPRSASNHSRLPLTPGSQPVNHILRCAYKSQAGTKRRQQRSCNQDALLSMPRLQGLRYQYLFAVFDGHGGFGHEVSSQAKQHLQTYIEESLLRTGNPAVLVTALRKAIARTAESIETLSLNTAYSGTTLTAVLASANDLICANIGDSRAVLGKLVREQWVACDLTNDHKPCVEEERQRILDANGRVHPMYNSQELPVGPDRVWLESGDVPGLAMTRSIGDQVAHTVGVISEPEITCFKLKSEDRFLIIATDGLWEVLSSQAAVELVGAELKAGVSDRCCTELIREATVRWEESGHRVDDITIIVVFLM